MPLCARSEDRRCGRGPLHRSSLGGDGQVWRGRLGGASISVEMGHGDLLVMGGSCQRTWEHAVPKVAHAGPRVSVQFRPLNVF